MQMMSEGTKHIVRVVMDKSGVDEAKHDLVPNEKYEIENGCTTYYGKKQRSKSRSHDQLKRSIVLMIRDQQKKWENF